MILPLGTYPSYTSSDLFFGLSVCVASLVRLVRLLVSFFLHL